MSKINEDLLDVLSIVNFIIGVANFDQNLTQSDKQDLVQKLDQTTREVLNRAQAHLQMQDEKLDMILERLRNDS